MRSSGNNGITFWRNFFGPPYILRYSGELFIRLDSALSTLLFNCLFIVFNLLPIRVSQVYLTELRTKLKKYLKTFLRRFGTSRMT